VAFGICVKKRLGSIRINKVIEEEFEKIEPEEWT